MACDAFAADIGALVEDELDPARQREVERHVERCPACRALVTDLRTIRAAAFTLERHEAPADAWPRLALRLADEPRPVGRRLPWRPATTRWGVWAAAAAVLVLATAVGLGSLLGDAPPAAPPADTGTDSAALVASVQADLETAEAHYQKAIDGLEQIAASDSEALDPQVAAVLQKNLQVIDQAIGESRAALRTEPTSQYAQESLFEAMRSKVSLLQQTVELINEMRQGNQAEAGRLIQGLNRP
ncbi:MAG: anti-sigma factor [Vicinamibacterales bacterium]